MNAVLRTPLASVARRSSRTLVQNYQRGGSSGSSLVGVGVGTASQQRRLLAGCNPSALSSLLGSKALIASHPPAWPPSHNFPACSNRWFSATKDGDEIDTANTASTSHGPTSCELSGEGDGDEPVRVARGAEDTAKKKTQQQHHPPPPPQKEEQEPTGEDSTTEEQEQVVVAPPSKEEELEAEIKQLKDHMLRSLADQENTRRIAQNDVLAAKKFAIKSFAKSLLDVSDNLERALQAIPEGIEHQKEDQPVLVNLLEGVRLTENGLLKAFQANGLERFGKVGEPFDPNRHDALFEYSDPKKESGTVGQVLKSGFLLNNRVLRPAEVGVVKNGDVDKGGTANSSGVAAEKP